MEDTENKENLIWNWKQVLLYIPVFFLIFFALVVTIIQIPIVQTKILNSLSQVVSSKTDYNIEIGHVNLSWYDNILFDDLKIYDNQDSVLLTTHHISANIGLYDLIVNKKVIFDEIELQNPAVHLIKKTDSTAINISEFIIQLKQNQQNKSSQSSPVIIESIKINNGTFTYNDLTKPLLEERKDYTHFGYKNISATANHFVQKADSIDFDLISMNATDIKEQLNIKSLSGLFSYCNQSITFSSLDLKTDKSQIRDSLRLNYASSSALSYFVDSVSFFVNLDSSFISSDDIALFAPNIDHINQTYELSGEIQGLIGDLRAKNIHLKFGQNTLIEGDLNFFGLPKVKETFIDVNLGRATLSPEDFLRYIPEQYRKNLPNTGTIEFKGQYLGFPTDFVSHGTFTMAAGFIKSDLNFKLEEGKKAQYSGNLILRDFDLGQVFNNEKLLQKIYFNGNIKGKGLDIKSAVLHLNAKIDSIGVMGYKYSNIYANGDLANGYFEGILQTKDPNLVFDGQVNIDIRNHRDKINISACLDALNLQPLGFSERNIFISSRIEVDIKEFHIDSLKGYINLKNPKLIIDSDKLELDSVKFLSFLVGDERTVSLETDGLSAEAKGNFKNSTVLNEFNNLYKELWLNIRNNQDSIDLYYSQKEVEIETFEVALKINLRDANKFVQPFYPNIQLSKGIILEGKFVSDKTSILSLNTNLDSLIINSNLFLQNQLDISISKKNSYRNTLSSFFLSSKEQNWNGNSRTDNIYLESIWSNNHVDLEFNLDQKEIKNTLNLRATIDFSQDSINFHFLESDIQALGKYWKFDSTNQITYINDKLDFNNVKLIQGIQSLALNGTLSDNASDQLHFDIREFNVSSLNSLLPMQISGVVDGNIDINKLENDVLIESNLRAKSFYIEDFLVGDIDCFSDWENNRDRLGMDFTVNRANKRIIDVNGYFYPKKDNNQLEMSAVFDSANLNVIQPFVKDQFSNLSGFASGKFSISGNPSSPILDSKDASGKITKGTIKINYTNTNYSFSGGILFRENQIGVENLVLVDALNNKATFNGGIFHDSFQHFVLDISGKYENFKLLNTGSKDNKLYYGSANATGDISILGAINNLQIDARAKTTKGTRISIPIGELSEYNVEQKDYITFVDLKDPEHQKRMAEIAKEEIDLKGLKLDFDIELTNDAYTELIFDVKAGDIIRGRGNGNIKLQIDPYGDFNMFGDLQIESGGYNFTLYNIINKEFDIQKGSSISWYGDPYGAKMNINARYRQLASLAPILTGVNADNSPDLRTKYPSIVDLYLKGNLLSPEISFDINIEDYPDNVNLNTGGSIPLDAQISAFKNRLAANEQEMKRQVFSLVILRKFSPENSFQVNGSQTFGNSLSEFVSNQLSYWATQVDENLEVDVNLPVLSDEAFNTFQLRLSYSFLDGRLKVTRGGGFANNNSNSNSDLSSIIGDWTVEYLLTPDGRFRAKMYSRSNINTAARELGENSTETGFSLQFVRSFDQLKNILIDSREKNQKNNETSDSTLNKVQGVRKEEEENSVSKSK
ncbi:translocation/assembly module TamB domain-containing protein [Reichenbachiella sp. MALMAid0571]|uniref:translocation/assembly module TamB domain-containing protein n=1 Tax=Reichenbachiella sp. MALMAid0571 TaxID=3143939 RepID=UPI0032DF42C5